MAAISLVSNVAPQLCQDIFLNCRKGRLPSARYLQSRLAPLTAALAKESPAALKYALCLLGFMRPDTRLPIVELDEAAKEKSPARSRRSATRRIWPARWKAGAAPSGCSRDVLPVSLSLRGVRARGNLGSLSGCRWMWREPGSASRATSVRDRACNIVPAGIFDRPVPGWAQKLHHSADGAAQKGNQNGCGERNP